VRLLPTAFAALLAVLALSACHDGSAPPATAAAPIPDAAAPVPDAAAPVPDGAAPAVDAGAPAPEPLAASLDARRQHDLGRF
jgi:hypothetical protein